MRSTVSPERKNGSEAKVSLARLYHSGVHCLPRPDARGAVAVVRAAHERAVPVRHDVRHEDRERHLVLDTTAELGRRAVAESDAAATAAAATVVVVLPAVAMAVAPVVVAAVVASLAVDFHLRAGGDERAVLCLS